MRLTLPIFFLSAVLLSSANAQQVKISGTVKNNLGSTFVIMRPTKFFFFNYFDEGFVRVPVKNGAYSVEFTVDEPEMMFMYFSDPVTRQLYTQYIFLKKGYSLEISFDVVGQKLMVTTTGIGANDNQSLPIKPPSDFKEIYAAKDSLPGNVFAKIGQAHGADSMLIADYQKKYEPSPEFIQAWQYQLKYQVLNRYLGFSERYQSENETADAYERNRTVWQNLLNRLFAEVKLSEDKALVSTEYQKVVRGYIQHTQGESWQEMSADPVAASKKWYGSADTSQTRKRYKLEMQNLFIQRIIEDHFSGKVKEYAYACIMENALE